MACEGVGRRAYWARRRTRRVVARNHTSRAIAVDWAGLDLRVCRRVVVKAGEDGVAIGNVVSARAVDWRNDRSRTNRANNLEHADRIVNRPPRAPAALGTNLKLGRSGRVPVVPGRDNIAVDEGVGTRAVERGNGCSQAIRADCFQDSDRIGRQPTAAVVALFADGSVAARGQIGVPVEARKHDRALAIDGGTQASGRQATGAFDHVARGRGGAKAAAARAILAKKARKDLALVVGVVEVLEEVVSRVDLALALERLATTVRAGVGRAGVLGLALLRVRKVATRAVAVICWLMNDGAEKGLGNWGQF